MAEAAIRWRMSIIIMPAAIGSAPIPGPAVQAMAGQTETAFPIVLTGKRTVSAITVSRCIRLTIIPTMEEASRATEAAGHPLMPF